VLSACLIGASDRVRRRARSIVAAGAGARQDLRRGTSGAARCVRLSFPARPLASDHLPLVGSLCWNVRDPRPARRRACRAAACDRRSLSRPGAERDGAQEEPSQSQRAAAQDPDLAAGACAPSVYSRPGEEPDSVVITSLPYPHGNHFHLGDALVASRDASGLRNPAVWAALERKGLIRSLPDCAMLTPLGVGYDTGLRDTILHVGGLHVGGDH